STDSGNTWTDVNSGLTAPILVLAIDPATPATLYAASSNAGMFKTTNGGGHWDPINNGFTYASACGLAIDPITPTRVYAISESVYKSTNGGSNWNLASAGPIAGCSIVIHPITTTTIYTVGALGVTKSTNGGMNWSTINSGLPSFPHLTTL